MVTELNAFNIGLDLSGIVLSLTGIVGVIISRKIMKRNWILFVSMFGANIAVMLSNLLGIVFKGDMSPFALRAIPIFNFCEFAFLTLWHLSPLCILSMRCESTANKSEP